MPAPIKKLRYENHDSSAGETFEESPDGWLVDLEDHERYVRELVKEIDVRDGNWIDKWGSCKVCGGEIPHGHSQNCDIYKMECQIRELGGKV